MEFRNLGPSGLRVSAVGLGCNGFSDLESARPVFNAALEHGVNFFDTADIYGGRDGVSEKIIGELAHGRRHEVIIATKCGFMPDGSWRRMGASRRYVMWAVEHSLRRLKTDYIDVYQIHSPDPLTPIEETLRALEDLTRQGKIRYGGGSNYAGWQIMEAHLTAKNLGLSGFISCQNEYSLLERAPQAEAIPAMLKCGLRLLPYFPLATGLLSGKYRGGIDPRTGQKASGGGIAAKLFTDANFARIDALAEFAAARGRTLLELSMSWLAGQPVVGCVISGASQPEQVAANVASAGWSLSAEELALVDAIARA